MTEIVKANWESDIVNNNDVDNANPAFNVENLKNNTMLRIYTGNRLFRLMVEHDLSIQEMAERFVLSIPCFVDLLIGKASIDIIHLWQINQLFKISLDDFFDGFEDFKTTELCFTRRLLNDNFGSLSMQNFFLNGSFPVLYMDLKNASPSHKTSFQEVQEKENDLFTLEGKPE